MLSGSERAKARSCFNSLNLTRVYLEGLEPWRRWIHNAVKISVEHAGGESKKSGDSSTRSQKSDVYHPSGSKLK